MNLRAAFVSLLGVAIGCSAPGSRVPGSGMPGPGESITASDGRYAMGTVLEIALVGGDENDLRGTLDDLFDLASRLDRLMTVYDPDSDLSRLNRSAGRGPATVDPELAKILRLAIAYSRLTGGSFDVTVGPLVALWTDAAARDTPPAAADLAATRQLVGSNHLRVGDGGGVELARAGVSIDLGGIAKGYALDRMLAVLRARGIGAALLNFGQSSTWAVGSPPDGPGWRLLVRGPSDDFLGVIRLRDLALSVSGSLGQWVEIGGFRYGHVLDPRTGWPLTRRRQALVVAPSAALAEALSKALVILGEVRGLALVAAQPGCEGLLADADGRLWMTPGWARTVAFEAWEPRGKRDR